MATLSQLRIAVTGASGFIGRGLVEYLHAQGADVVAITVEPRPTAPLDALGFTLERHVVADISRLGEAVKQAGAEHIVHLAGYVSTRRTVEALRESTQWNLMGTLALLEAAADMHAKRVVLLGSCEEYGQNIAPFQTDAAPDPLSPYGASKAAITAYARMFSSSFGLPTVVLRPSVVYGPGQSPRMLISQVMQGLAEGRSIDVTAGEQTRDFIFIDDIVRYIGDALTLDHIAGDVWNAASGEVVSVRECLERIERITGIHGLIRYGARAYEDRETFQYQLDMSRTYARFGWRPHLPLTRGLELTWAAIHNRVM
jgi:nucleoside-diphosphate-sugar epimerase